MESTGTVRTEPQSDQRAPLKLNRVRIQNLTESIHTQFAAPKIVPQRPTCDSSWSCCC
jgi:hypothetical protein